MKNSNPNLDKKDLWTPVTISWNWTKDNPELLDAIGDNPYGPETEWGNTPAGRFCFGLYNKTSPDNKRKMQKNIKINALGNVEMDGREFSVLHATPNDVDILEKDGISFFRDDAAEREAKAQGYALFDTPAQADKFIDDFVGGKEETHRKIRVMMILNWLFTDKIKTWFYWRRRANDSRPKEWWRSRGDDKYHVSYAILTKNDEKGNKYWVMCRYQLEDDLKTRTLKAEARTMHPEFWYPAIVSRPIQK